MKDYLRVSEAARRLGVRPETVRWWFDTGKLRGMRLPSRERRIERAHVEAIRNGEGSAQ